MSDPVYALYVNASDSNMRLRQEKDKLRNDNMALSYELINMRHMLVNQQEITIKMHEMYQNDRTKAYEDNTQRLKSFIEEVASWKSKWPLK